MKQILLVTADKNKFSVFSEAITSESQAGIAHVDSMEKAITSLSGNTPNLIIIDEDVNGTPGLKIARDILMKNAMVNQAVVSRLSAEDFHEVSEGLGIMAQLTPEPDADQAKTVLEILGKMP